MALWIKRLLLKHGGINLDLQNQGKNPGMVMYVYNPVAVGIETGDSLKHIGQPTKPNE